MMQEYFFFLKHIDPLIMICSLVAGVGVLWYMDIEKSPWMLFLFFLALMLFVHFGVVA
jgi:hypothetical protein